MISGKSKAKLIASSKRNPCPICQKTHGCKISDNLIMCLRGDNNYSVPGWKYLKPLKGGMGGLFGADSGERREYRPEQQPKAKPTNITPLTDEQLNIEAVKILKQLGLTAKHRESLINRGLTDTQINSIGFVSVDRYQEFNLIPISPNFPGMGTRGTLANGGSGILIPVRNIKGLIIGFQLARDDRNPKYQWLWGSSERRLSGELPLQFNKTNDSRELNIIEGTQKPLTAAHLHNINVLGAGGVNWHGSKKEFKGIVNSKLFDLYILNPDTGSKLNHHVMGAYRELYLFLKKLGITLYVRDWGQGDRPKSDKLDVDEIDTETFNNARIISYIEWDNNVLDKGELSEEQWFNRFKLPKLHEDLANVLKRFYHQKQAPKTEAKTSEQTPEQSTIINQNCSAIVPYVPQKLTTIKYVPGQLPTASERAEMGYPKIIFEEGERLQLISEIYNQGSIENVLDSTPTGHGKSSDAGLISLETFGIDPDDKENKTKIFYLSPDHRNPTTSTVEANYTDLEARHNGLNYDHTRTTALGKPHLVRAKNQNPDIPSNCPENQTFLAVSELGLLAFGGKDSPICQSCPLLNQGCLFLENRRDTLTNKRLIRADINSIHPSSKDILILDDLSITNTHQITISNDEILKTVGSLQIRGDDERIFKALRPVLVSVWKALQSVTTDKHKYGISHHEVMELMPTDDEINQLIWQHFSDDWLACDNVWGEPIYHYEMIDGVPTATKVIGEEFVAPSLIDLRNECHKISENYAKFINGLQTPEEKQQAIKDNVIPAWLPSNLDCLTGNKRINLHIDNGKLAITKLSKRHRNIIKNAGFTIALDATKSKHDYALSLGVNQNEILEISEVKRSTNNQTIYTINGLGKGGKQRRDSMQDRINIAVKAIAQRHQGQNVGLIDHKSAIDSYKDLTQSVKPGYWHKDTRGSNQFLNTQVLISVGLPTPNLGQMAGEYQALTGYSPVPDKLVGHYGEWVKRKIQAELIQCVGRPRAHLRPTEELHIYIIADLDEDTASAIRLAYPTANFITEDIYDIAPEAASKGVQTERGIFEAMMSMLKQGIEPSIDQVAEAIGKAKSTITFTLKHRLGIGFRAVKKSLVLLLEAINNKTKLSELDDELLYIANEYLPDVVADFERGDTTPVDVVTEIITTAKAFGERQFRRILAATPIPTLCKLLGAVLRFIPPKLISELIPISPQLITA